MEDRFFKLEQFSGHDNHNRGEQERVLSIEEAKKMYTEGVQLRDRVIDIVKSENIDLNAVFTSVHRACFGHLNAEEVSRHIMHRVLVGTMISDQEARSLVFDETDLYIYEQFLVPASCASSGLEVEKIGLMIQRYDDTMKTVQ